MVRKENSKNRKILNMKKKLLLLVLISLLFGSFVYSAIRRDGNYFYHLIVGPEGIDLGGPLKFGASSLLSPVESGAMEYNGCRFFITGSGARRVLSRASDSIITPVTVANTTDETTVFTAPLPAASLCVNKVYIIEAYGKGSTHDAADVLTIRAKVNGTTLLSLASTPKQVTDVPMHLRLICTVRTVGATGTFSSHGDIRIEDTENHTNISSTVVDTTAANNIIITFQWDDANAGNTATVDQAFLMLNN